MFSICLKSTCRLNTLLVVCLVNILTSSISVAETPTPGSVIDPVDKPVVKPDSPDYQPVVNDEDTGFTPPKFTKKIHVKRFDLLGNTLFDDEVLLAEITDYVDKPITLAQIYEAADSIQRFYRLKGFLLASVYVPAQKISSGTVNLEIVEGRLASVVVDDELTSYQPGFINNQLDTLELGDIITSVALEEEMLLLNDLPGLTARAVILPGQEYGTSNIVIKAEEDISTATLRINNHGRKSLGETRVEAGWLRINPFSQGDQINFSTVLAEDSRMIFGRVDYDALINHSGTRLGGGISAFSYEVDTQEIGLTGTLEGDGLNGRIQISHPLIRRQRNRLDFSATVRNAATSEDGSLALSADVKIVVLDLALNWQPVHDNGSTSILSAIFTSNFKKNLDSDDAVQAKIEVDYSYSKPFAQNWFALLQLKLVSSAEPLPDVERFRIGGPASVRAYTPSEIAGDEGSLVRLDVGRQFRISGNSIMIVKLFADTGKVSRILPLAGELKDETLTGYGAGLLFNFGSRHTLELEVVTPTTDLVASDGRESRAWLNYSALF